MRPYNLLNKPKQFFALYTARHFQAGFNSLGQLSRTPMNTFMTCVVIGIALALPMTLLVLLKNVETLSQHLRQGTQITLYLKSTTTDAQATDLVYFLKKMPGVSSVQAISPAQGLHELQQQAGVDTAVANLPSNPLPWAIVILPSALFHSTQDLTTLSHTLQQITLVDSVQLDALWIERLFALITFAHRAIYGLALFLGIAVLLIVNNCIRSATQQSRKEIDVIKLIGGTHSFIRRPFLYAGMIYGLLGGIIAWQLVDLLLVWLREPTSQLANLYNSAFTLSGIGFLDSCALLILSVALGLLGAWLAVHSSLKSHKL